MQTPCTLEIERSELELLWYAIIFELLVILKVRFELWKNLSLSFQCSLYNMTVKEQVMVWIQLQSDSQTSISPPTISPHAILNGPTAWFVERLSTISFTWGSPLEVCESWTAVGLVIHAQTQRCVQPQQEQQSEEFVWGSNSKSWSNEEITEPFHKLFRPQLVNKEK